MKKEIILVAFGLCAWMAISSFAYSVELFFENLFILTKLSNKFKFWLVILLYNFSVIIPFYFLLKSMMSNFDYLKWIKLFIIIYLIAQLFQFLFILYGVEYIIENFHKKWTNQIDFNQKYYLGRTVFPIFIFIKFIALGLLFYSFYKKESNESSPPKSVH